MTFLSAFARAFGQLVAAGEQTGLDKLFRWGGRILLVLSALYFVLIPAYLYRHVSGIPGLIENGTVGLLAAGMALGFAKLCRMRRELRARGELE